MTPMGLYTSSLTLAITQVRIRVWAHEWRNKNLFPGNDVPTNVIPEIVEWSTRAILGKCIVPLRFVRLLGGGCVKSKKRTMNDVKWWRMLSDDWETPFKKHIQLWWNIFPQHMHGNITYSHIWPDLIQMISKTLSDLWSGILRYENKYIRLFWYFKESSGGSKNTYIDKPGFFVLVLLVHVQFGEVHLKKH